MEIRTNDDFFNDKIHKDFSGRNKGGNSTEEGGAPGVSDRPPISEIGPGLQIVPTTTETPDSDIPPPAEIPKNSEWNPLVPEDEEELPN